MSKDVVIKVPCAHYEMRACAPEAVTERATLHFVPVPEEALAEVQEILKKYQPQIDKFMRLLKKTQEG